MEFAQRILTWANKQEEPICTVAKLVMCLMLPFLIFGEFLLYIFKALQ